jgi:tetratricopeptide (TPR) repeat protein
MDNKLQTAIEVLVAQCRWLEAIAALQVVLGEQPINARMQAQLGFCHFQLRNFQAAEQAFRAATMIDTRFWQAGRMHAECLDRLGEYEEALRVAEHWYVIEPNDPFLTRLVEGLRRNVPNNSGAWVKNIYSEFHEVVMRED